MKNMKLKNSTDDIIDFICLKLNGKKCTKNEKKVLNLLFQNLYSFENNELLPNSSMIAYLMTGCGLDYPQVLSSAINSFGDAHLPVTKICQFIINDFKNNEKYYPGFGHPVYKQIDPRVEDLVKLVKKLKITSINIDKCIKFSQEKNICFNIGGFTGAFLIDIGFDIYSANYIPIISRMLGLSIIYKKTKKNKLRFATSLDNIHKYKKLSEKDNA